MPRVQLNVRLTAEELATYRAAAKEMGYAPREWSQWVRTACALFAGVAELEEAKDQRIISLVRELERLRRAG